MKENFDDFIGYEIGVLDKNCKEYKKITIVDYKYLENSDVTIFVGDDGELYDEWDLNWVFKLTPAAVMMVWLQDNREEIMKVLNDFDYMSNGIMNSWFDMLKKQGILVSNKDDKAEKADADTNANTKPKPDSVGDMLFSQWLKFSSHRVLTILKDENEALFHKEILNQLFNEIMGFLEKKEYIKKGDE